MFGDPNELETGVEEKGKNDNENENNVGWDSDGSLQTEGVEDDFGT